MGLKFRMGTGEWRRSPEWLREQKSSITRFEIRRAGARVRHQPWVGTYVIEGNRGRSFRGL
jgi:hypothetical protein